MKPAARALFKSPPGDDTFSRLKPLTRPSWLSLGVWPFDTFGLEVDGNTVAVTDVGEGPVLLFVHTGLWSFVWRDVIKRLEKEFRCVAFDAPAPDRAVA